MYLCKPHGIFLIESKINTVTKILHFVQDDKVRKDDKVGKREIQVGKREIQVGKDEIQDR